jgi:pimeloyl-ACP methyl ester carboxylesterase
MHDRWIVLGGWGVEPEVLRPVFGNGSVYIDINRIMPDIVNGGKLFPDWRERCAAFIEPHLRQPLFLSGWSTGAIIALGAAGLLSIDALVLMSATPSFCRTRAISHTRAFRHGMRPIVLRSMREKLSIDPSAVLHEFREACGLTEDTQTVFPWTTDELMSGLHALEQMTLFDLAPLRCKPLFIHGKNDTIIPHAAGESLHRKLGGTLLSLNAPHAQHACFINNESTIRSSIDNYLKGILNEPV